MKKHLKVTSDEEKLVSLLCEWVFMTCTGRQGVNFSARRQPVACTSLEILDLKHGFD